MNHPILDWVPRHDPLSRNYAIRSIVAPLPENWAKDWHPGAVLDQGQEGACVGFGHTGDLLSSPRPLDVMPEIGNVYAQGVYRHAKEIDEWEGIDYEGTSVLAGAKVMKERGHIASYHWAFGIEDIALAIQTTGPVVIGIPWYDGMYETKDNGVLETTGRLVGGHCILVYGYHPRMRISGEGWLARHEVFKLRNSWGPYWGRGGNALIRSHELATLLDANGEACVPTDRFKANIA